MEHDFEEGDVVQVMLHNNDISEDLFDGNEEICYGMTGTILEVNNDSLHNILIEFDTDVGGHDGSRDNTEYGHCWWVSHKIFKAVNKKPSVLEKIKQLDAKFEERKSNNANHLPVQDGKSKCKVFGHKLTSTESIPF